MAFRVPVPDVSVVDLTVRIKTGVSSNKEWNSQVLFAIDCDISFAHFWLFDSIIIVISFDRDQCDFKMAVILAAIFKMATKMRKISKCSNFNENWYVRFFPHEECDSDKAFFCITFFIYNS